MAGGAYIPQAQLGRLASVVAPSKVAVLYGPGRVGKTTLIRRYVRWRNAYPESAFQVVHPGNYLGFVTNGGKRGS